MKLRSLLFWAHLICGVVTGIVIFIMSVTGTLLMYQRQMTAWADMRGYYAAPGPDTRRLSPDRLVANVRRERPDLSPTTLVIRADPSAPASLAVAPGRTLFVNPYSGTILGEGQGQSTRNFFRVVTEWHRYLGRSGESRPMGRAITGFSNLAFFFIVLSGLFLWWPRTWTWKNLRGVTWFKRGLSGKARDFNWHNTIGFWSAIPLAVIVAGALVISYPWATGLVYRAYGEAPPAPAGAQGSRAGGLGGRGGPAPSGSPAGGSRGDLAPLLEKAETQMRSWRSISIALPAPDARRVVFTLDAGDGGQPDKRGTLTLDRATGEIVQWEPFSSLSPGRRTRIWLRFAHTGEVYGLAGQTIAGVLSAGGGVLMWTGLALAFRRFLTWQMRWRKRLEESAAA